MNELFDTQSSKSKKATLSSSSFAITKINCTVIIMIQFSTKNRIIMNKMNLFKLFFPTQLFIHGQWWSYCSMQVLHISQWCARGGRYWTHRRHIYYIYVAISIELFRIDWELTIVPSEYFDYFSKFFCIMSLYLPFFIYFGSTIKLKYNNIKKRNTLDWTYKISIYSSWYLNPRVIKATKQKLRIIKRIGMLYERFFG